ncbi:hypothetical protein ACHAXR_009838 [Thalassiosira sp. AJA248-18]
MFTMDATGVYTNIDTHHSLGIFKCYIEVFKFLSYEAPTPQQLCGTVMGAASACMYATVYYASHKITVLLQKYSKHLIFYQWLIGGGFGL